MSDPERDRTHWHGCYTDHHECAVREVERMKGTLGEIARQMTRAELAEDYGEESGDFEAGYDAIVMIARRALERVEKGGVDG